MGSPNLFTIALPESLFTPVIGQYAALQGGPVGAYTSADPDPGNPDVTLARVAHRQQAWRARIAAMARTTVRVLDFGNLPQFDSFGQNLEFHLHAIRTLHSAAKILGTLSLPVESLHRLASSDEPNLPMPPDMFINNRHGHVIISDSAKGTKPGKKTWWGLEYYLERAGWRDFNHKGLIGGAKFPDLCKIWVLRTTAPSACSRRTALSTLLGR